VEYRKENPEVERRSDRKFYANNKERRLAEQKEYHEKNKDWINERNNKYWHKTKPERNKRQREYYQENREARIAYNNKELANKENFIGVITGQDIHEAYKKQSGKCVYCGYVFSKKGAKGHVDHIYPKSKYKYNGPENIQILCQNCNISKNAKDPITYETKINFITPEREAYLLQLLNFIEEKLSEHGIKLAA